ncbi:MAG: glycosyltransferase family 1 protein [Salinivirgaceae bacterium]|nr:glycosyltransferase family 1 protein [Salinivirgaceae bacterium]
MNEPIRILQVLAGMNRGGSEAFIMNVYRNIDRSKVQFDFILYRKEECDFNEEIRQLGGRIFWVPRYTGKNHFKFKNAWNKFFKEHSEYKIIHGHVRSAASIYLSIARKYGLRTIAHSHSTSSRGNILEQLGKKILQYPIRKIADHLFACSEKAGKWLFGKNRNFKVINNAIEVDKYIFEKSVRAAKRDELKIKDKFVIGHIGTFTHPKNHSFLIDVFKEIHKKYSNAVLLLIGKGELQSIIEKKVNYLGLTENVIFTGVRADIPELLQAMDVFVFPSLFEGLPVTLIEAQASGLKCVVSDSITKEVGITDCLEFVSLKDSPAIWSNKIIDSFSCFIRKNNYEEVKTNGYDIQATSNWLEFFYMSL